MRELLAERPGDIITDNYFPQAHYLVGRGVWILAPQHATVETLGRMRDQGARYYLILEPRLYENYPDAVSLLEEQGQALERNAYWLYELEAGSPP